MTKAGIAVLGCEQSMAMYILSAITSRNMTTIATGNASTMYFEHFDMVEINSGDWLVESKGLPAANLAKMRPVLSCPK